MYDWNSILQHRKAYEGYESWIAEQLEDHKWRPYLLTFMFNPLLGTEASRLREMEVEIARVYGALLTRVSRKPHQKSPDELPRMFAVPDKPVP